MSGQWYDYERDRGIDPPEYWTYLPDRETVIELNFKTPVDIRPDTNAVRKFRLERQDA